MAYFNHAFQKTILAVDGLIQGDGDTMLWDVNDKALFADAEGQPKTQHAQVAFVGTDGENKDVVLSTTAGETITPAPFVIAGTTLRPKDKIGKFMAGFQSLNTSKKINPKFIDRIYVVLPQEAKNAYVTIGASKGEDGELALCDYPFECGTTYNLQLNVKGNVVASTLMHNYFRRVPAYVSCCGVDNTSTADIETSVDTIKVYYEWAKNIKADLLLEDLVEVVLYAGKEGDDVADLQAYTKDGIELDGEETLKFEELEKAFEGEDAPTVGYLKVVAAFEETMFGNCTWQKNEYLELQPMEIYASLVDTEGNPCFKPLCIERFAGEQKTRTGDSLLKEVILDESYHQRFFNSDLRKREAEGADGVMKYIDRAAQYPGVYLLHSIPRKQNPSSTFDNDQYLIQIITTGDATVSDSTVTLSGNLKDIVDGLKAVSGIEEVEIFTK